MKMKDCRCKCPRPPHQEDCELHPDRIAERRQAALDARFEGQQEEWWLTRLGFATPADETEAEKIKQLSKATYKAAVENTLAASATSNEYSTHHRSCALRHDGITCTCP